MQFGSGSVCSLRLCRDWQAVLERFVRGRAHRPGRVDDRTATT